MLKIIVTTGCPGSGKSTWAKAEVAKDPLNWVRICNDDLRAMMNNSEWSADYEKIIANTRSYIISEALKKNKSVIVDNVHGNRRHFSEICKIVKKANVDAQVFEKVFYVDLKDALERNAQRTGKARVPDYVVEKWHKALGGKQFKFYKPRVEIFHKTHNNSGILPMAQDENLKRAAIFDNDGTISLIHSGRSPYDASSCHLDAPHMHVIECMKLYYNAGYEIIFVSGREEKDREPTEMFYQKYFPEVKYKLFMRKTNDNRRDVIIKEEIFNEHIKNKYFVAAWFDDRLQVSKWVYESGLPLFRVNDPEADF